MRLLVAGAAFLGFAAVLCAQDAGKLEFEVASVKPAEIPANGIFRFSPPGGPGTADPTHINYPITTLRNLLMIAYNVKTYQINGPTWLDTERYEVKATLAPGTTKEQEAVMMQNLLAQRFNVKLHHETKDLPFYELTVARGGLKMKPYVEKPDDLKMPAPGDPLPPPPPPPLPGKGGMPRVPVGGTFIMMTNGKLHMMSRKVDMPQVAGILSDNLRSQVVDKTGVKGDFDFDVEFSTEGLAGAPMFLGGGPGPAPGPGLGPGPGPGPGIGPGASDSGEAPALVTAVQEQLGLKLEQKRGPLDLIVVDHADKNPAEN